MHNKTREPIGQAWLLRHFDLAVPSPAVQSCVVAGTRRTETDGRRVTEFYPTRYAVEDSVIAHLLFALRHEAFDLGLLIAALRAMDPATLEEWVQAQPTGAFSRRAWFFYETFTGRTLDLDDAKSGNYVSALDHRRHVGAGRRNSRRHRVADNLLGGAELCPSVRLTPKLRRAMKSSLDEEARALMEGCEASILTRAVNYLFTKETRSSFALEGETPSGDRAERFVAALKSASGFDAANKADILRLHAIIVDPRYAADDWRTVQNFVGETIGGYRERVHFICPRPKDVPSLMRGWTALTERVLQGHVDPVVGAAASSFAFVFVHPFEDGNGRIHRFLMHHVLAKRGYGVPGTILPVSAAILRDRHGYDDVLSGFSRPQMDLIRWEWSGGDGAASGREIVVSSESDHLYRYFDATPFAEYFYDRVADAVHHDLREELGFLAVFDRALRSVSDIVDMPDRRASLLVRLCLQNSGRLAARKRRQFAELTDDEIRAMEAEIQEAMASAGSG